MHKRDPALHRRKKIQLLYSSRPYPAICRGLSISRARPENMGGGRGRGAETAVITKLPLRSVQCTHFALLAARKMNSKQAWNLPKRTNFMALINISLFVLSCGEKDWSSQSKEIPLEGFAEFPDSGRAKIECCLNKSSHVNLNCTLHYIKSRIESSKRAWCSVA